MGGFSGAAEEDHAGFNVGAAEEGTETFTESISRIVVKNISGNVTVKSTSGPVVFSWKKKGPTQDSLDNLEVLYSVSDGVLTIKIDYKTPNGRAYADMDLEIPDGVDNLKIDNVSGNIEVRGMADSLNQELETISGNVFTDAGGRVSLKSTSGNIEAWTQGRSLEIKSTSGDVRFTFEGEEFKAKSVSGDIKGSIEKAGELKEMEITTVSGTIRVDAPDDLSAELSMKTTSGDMNCDFSLDHSSIKEDSLSGTIGSGNAKVKFKTVSGDMRLE